MTKLWQMCFTLDTDPTRLPVPSLLAPVFPECPPPPLISRGPGVSWTLTWGWPALKILVTIDTSAHIPAPSLVALGPAGHWLPPHAVAQASPSSMSHHSYTSPEQFAVAVSILCVVHLCACSSKSLTIRVERLTFVWAFKHSWNVNWQLRNFQKLLNNTKGLSIIL